MSELTIKYSMYSWWAKILALPFYVTLTVTVVVTAVITLLMLLPLFGIAYYLDGGRAIVSDEVE